MVIHACQPSTLEIKSGSSKPTEATGDPAQKKNLLWMYLELSSQLPVKHVRFLLV